jgi:hypothetical protein
MRPNILETAAGIAGGALGGAIGTFVIEKEIGLARKLPAALRMPEMRGDPAELFVRKAEQLAKRPLSPLARERAIRGLHLAYGAAWPAALGLVERFARSRSLPKLLLRGAALGAIVWGAGYLGWLPRAGITRRLREEVATKHLSSLVAHAIYGVVSSVPIFVVGCALERRRARGWRGLARRVLRRAR